ncbi:hypothetical protein ABZR88_07025 [Mucilaginibacter yixingensis]|nr:hypothetical protein [Mucilaginibacter yixingensis]
MANLSSKIQYKTYEKGEFSDEQSRSLEETLELIKSFPWDTQRGVDVQASGPGIVIHGPANDYLKVAIYYNSKFTVYYLDPQNRLYEFHTADLDVADQKVIDFFDNALSLPDFEKHFFNIGNKSHFETKSFWYAVDRPREKRRLIAAILVITLYFGGLAVVTVCKDAWGFCFGLLLLISFFFYGIYQQIKVYRWSKNMKLWITRGSDVIAFDDGSGSQTYFKSEISSVNIYGRPAGRGRVTTTIMELYFADGRSIKFSAMLIDPTVFIASLRDQVNIKYLEQFSTFRKSIRQL